MTRKRWLRWIFVVCLTPILLVLVVLLSSPLWLNQDWVKREVTKIISNATGGKAQFDRIELHLLPFPGVVVSRLRFSLPGVVEVETQSVAVDIRPLPLLFGNVYPHRVQILSPQVRVHLDEPKPSSQPQPEAKPFSLKDTEARVRGILGQIEKAAPGLAAEVRAGKLELRIGERPPIVLERLDVHVDVSTSAVSAKISCGSNLLEQFAAELRLASKDLDGEGHVEVSRLQVPSLAPVLGLEDGWPVQEAEVNAKVKWRMRGLSDAQAEATVDAQKVTLQFGKGRLDLVAPAIDVAAQIKGGIAEVIVRRVAVDSPRVAATARFTHSETGGFALESETADVDLPTVLSVAQGVAPDVDWLANFPVSFQRGTATTLKFSTQAAKLEDLFDLPALRINGTVDHVDLAVSVFYNLQVHQISAVASLENGVVRAQQVQARLDKTVAHDGIFEMDVKPDVPTLRAELVATVDLPEALGVAKRVLPDKQIQQQLAQVKQLEGAAVAHVSIAGDVNNIVPRVEVTALNASARHAAVPFPIRVARGALTYTNEALSVQGMDGAIGQSSFNQVSARLRLSAPYPLSAEQGSVLLALEELFRWAAAQPKLAKQLEGVKSVSGSLAVSVTHVDIPLDALDRMRFQISATPRNVLVDAPRYGPRARLDDGVIQVTQQSVAATGVNASTLDAQLKLGGSTDNYREGISSVQARASGNLGVEALKWIYARAHLPRWLRLRAALTVSEASMDWQKGAGVGARGSVNVAGGPVIGFSLRRTPKRLELEKLTVRDDVSDLTFGGSLEGSHFKAAFKGKLAGSSIDRTFTRPLVSPGQLQGDFRADGDLKHPDATTATGYLQGSKMQLPPLLPVPVTIEKLSLEAKNTVLLIKSATVSSGESRVDVSGSVTYLKDKFAVDADVKGDKIVIPEAPEKPEKPEPKASDESAGESPSLVGDPEAQQKFFAPLWEIPLSGTVRLDIGMVLAQQLEVAPLVGSASLETRRLTLSLTRAALCGITLSGGVLVTPDDADAELKLGSSGVQLDKSIACLTKQRVQITGKLDMEGAFSAHGKLGTMLQQMQGTFSATAKDGHINKFDSLAAVLKVINVTQVIAGQLPDLSKGGMDYKSAQVKGRVEGRKIFFHEFALDASALTVAAHGNVDYATGAMDMTVLVAPFKTVSWVIQHMPILRTILGGMLIAVPVQVRGTIDKPIVVPLGPTAVGSRVLDILGNTLKLPGDAIKLVTPTQKPATQQPATQQPATATPSGR